MKRRWIGENLFLATILMAIVLAMGPTVPEAQAVLPEGEIGTALDEIEVLLTAAELEAQNRPDLGAVPTGGAGGKKEPCPEDSVNLLDECAARMENTASVEVAAAWQRCQQDPECRRRRDEATARSLAERAVNMIMTSYVCSFRTSQVVDFFQDDRKWVAVQNRCLEEAMDADGVSP